MCIFVGKKYDWKCRNFNTKLWNWNNSNERTEPPSFKSGKLEADPGVIIPIICIKAELGKCCLCYKCLVELKKHDPELFYGTDYV